MSYEQHATHRIADMESTLQGLTKDITHSPVLDHQDGYADDDP